MSRTFTKNTANYMSLGVGGLSTKLHHSGKITFAAWIKINSFSTASNDNVVISVINNGSSVGLALSVDGSVGGVAKVRIGARSTPGETRQILTGATTIPTGSWHHIAAVIDYVNKTLTVYLDGVVDAGPTAATWANLYFASVALLVGADTIGGYLAPPTVTTNQIDADVKDVGIWSDDIGTTNIASLAGGTSITTIAVASQVDIFTLAGTTSPEPSSVAGSTVVGTITGSIPQGSSQTTGTGSVTGAGTATGIGKAASRSVGSVTGAATALGVNSLQHIGVGSAVGAATVTGHTTNIVMTAVGSVVGMAFPSAYRFGSAYVLTVSNVIQNIQPGWTINEVTNGRNEFVFTVVSNDGTYRPVLDQSVSLFKNGIRVFGGNITRVVESGLGGLGVVPIAVEVTATDFNVIPEQQFDTVVIPTGTLKAAMIVLAARLNLSPIPGLTAMGLGLITIDPLQVDGPNLPELTYTYVKMSEMLADLTLQSNGYLWEIDYNGVFRMFVPGSRPAPFNILTNGLAIGDITVEPTRDNYANLVYVRNATINVLSVSFPEIALHGRWEALYSAPDTATAVEMQAMSDAMLARSIVVLKKVTYHTNTIGLHPGQSQTINIPARNINNTYLITSVKRTGITVDIVDHAVEAIEGLVYQPGWRELWKKMTGGSSIGNSGGTIGGGGVGGGSPFIRNAYFLGGTGMDFVRSSPAGWIPASPIQVPMDTVVRGSVSVDVTVQLMAADPGVSVQARLYDVTADLPCPGLSAVVTSTNWVLETFGATLTPGSHLYQLQILPSLANSDVGAIGYVE